MEEKFIDNFYKAKINICVLLTLLKKKWDRLGRQNFKKKNCLGWTFNSVHVCLKIAIITRVYALKIGVSRSGLVETLEFFIA